MKPYSSLLILLFAEIMTADQLPESWVSKAGESGGMS